MESLKKKKECKLMESTVGPVIHEILREQYVKIEMYRITLFYFIGESKIYW